MTTISVALTTYNGESFLQQQLDSIVAQTQRPDELVVTDDQSTDKTWAILTHFAETAPFPVRLNRNDASLGWRGNFMYTLSMCTSELVVLCDQDDVWHPDKLASAAAAMEQPDVLLFFHNAWLIDRAGARIGPADIFALPAYNPPLSVHSFFSPFGFSMVCRRSLLQFSDLWERSSDSNNRNNRAPHDQWLFFLATIFGAVVYSDRRLADYRQHGNNAVGPPRPTRLLPRWLDWLTNPGGRYHKLATAARDRAVILAESQGRLTGVWRDRAMAGEQRCLQLASRLESRAQLYECAAITSRIDRLVGLYREGTYRDRSGWGFNRSSLAKDAVLGVLLRPFLPQPGADAP